MGHLGRLDPRLMAVATLAVACSGSDESRGMGGAGGSADSAELAATTGSPAELRVSNVMIGRKVGSNNLITEPTFQFAPRDTVFISVATEGSGGATALTAAWRSQSGEVLQKTSEPVPASGKNAGFSLAQPKGLKLGTYKVIVFLDNDSVDTKVFVVKK
jgi:hypothetical protein